MKTTRRTFLLSAAALTAATSSPFSSFASFLTDKKTEKRLSDKSGHVVIVQRPEALKDAATVIYDSVYQMLGDGMCRLTGLQKPSDAWSSLFQPSAKIGIKVNAMGGPRICTHAVLAYAVARHLIAAGLPAANIIIWDRLSTELAKAGYTVQNADTGIKCYGTDASYEASIETSGSVGSCFSTIIARQCDALINIPVLKDHELSGVSLGLKNFYGAIHNPNKYHDNGCDPYIADLNCHPYIRNKLCLTIIDALTAQYQGGPAYRQQWNWPYAGLIFSHDPVAADRIGAQIIDQQRIKCGLPLLTDAGRDPVHIQTAAKRGLGNGDFSSIQKIFA